MARSLIKFLSLILLLIGLTGCNLFGGTPTPEPVEVQIVKEPDVVSAEAFVVPIKQANLAFEMSGRLDSLAVDEGETVEQGQIIGTLDNTGQKIELAQAEAQRDEAQANLTNVQAGPTSEEIAEAEARVAKAEAYLAHLLAGPTSEEIAEAEAKVDTARAGLAQVVAGARDEDLRIAAATMQKTEADVRLAQADYDRYVYEEPDVAEPYGIALQQSTLAYEQAKREYQKLVNGSTEEEVAVARARLNEAEAALAQTKAGPTAEQIAQGRADVEAAEAALAELKAGSTPEEIRIAEAGVQTAEANLELYQANLAKTQLVAPFSGVVGLLQVDEGEFIQAGTPILSLGDTSTWQIETDDLTEIDVVNVQEGAKVSISVDALPDETYEGVVVRITPRSVEKAGDETYTVLIDITSGPVEKLRWGMTTFVDIEVGPEL